MLLLKIGALFVCANYLLSFHSHCKVYSWNEKDPSLYESFVIFYPGLNGWSCNFRSQSRPHLFATLIFTAYVCMAVKRMATLGSEDPTIVS
jgi:hypothetical protein